MNSAIWNFVIPAGGSVRIPASGTQYEFLVMTAAVAVRTGDGKKFGQFNTWQPGLGQKDLNFTGLEFKNLSAISAAVSVLIGDASLINHQLILAQNQNPDVTNPVQPLAAGSAGNIQIPDLSGSLFYDINGNPWIALFRRSIIVSNFSTGTTLFLQKFGSTSASANAVLMIPPGLPIAHNSSGNFTISVGGAGVPALVSEIYSCIPATFV